MEKQIKLTFDIEIENIKLEVTGEYYHAPDIIVGEFAGSPARQDESEFEIKQIDFTQDIRLKLNSGILTLSDFPININKLLPLIEDKIYPICFDKARELYLDKLSKNE